LKELQRQCILWKMLVGILLNCKRAPLLQSC
jgi:hypothetical protein